jgi:DNA phosphorothioation-associated putative methyltransferase
MARADQLLYAVNDDHLLSQAITESSLGKVLPDDFYLHVSAVAKAPALIRVYEGCARVLVGDVVGATILKFQRVNRRVAYMSYPTFDRDPHPALAWSMRADLRTLDVRLREFRQSANPPILHRKEALVDPGYPGRAKFARLSVQEERAGLLGRPDIGTREAWQEALKIAGYRLQGHRLVAAH